MLVSNFNSIWDWVYPGDRNLKYEVIKKDSNIYLNIAVPGLTKEDVKIKIRGDTDIVLELEESMFLKKNTYYFSSEEKINIIKASVENGILTIELRNNTSEREITVI